MKFGKLFLRKVIKTVATRCLDFSSKRPKMRLVAGLRPDPLGELKRSPRPLAAKGGLLLREWDGRERGKGGERRGRKGRGGKGGVEGRERGKGGEGRGGDGKEREKEGALLISGQRGLFP